MAGLASVLLDFLRLFGVSWSFDLGSGYSVEGESMDKAAELRAACDDAMANPAFQPHDHVTYCNKAVGFIAERVGVADFPASMLANQQVAFAESFWESVTPEEAQERANRGEFVVAAKEYPVHGHVAVVYPKGGECGISGSWGKVPWLANIGKTNGVLKASECFPVKEGKPGYWACPQS